MSAALQLSTVWGTCAAQADWRRQPRILGISAAGKPEEDAAEPPVSLAFYRKHTEKILRRFLYASMQVGRAPSILSDPVGRGWASSRPIRTFEDAVIFVLDVERCLDRLGSLDRQMLSRIVLQEYTQAEAAVLLGMSVRTISTKFPQALDRLTEKLLETGLLVLPG
jgi:DNA-directed RNA polymerase specialized sigma24 family protein